MKTTVITLLTVLLICGTASATLVQREGFLVVAQQGQAQLGGIGGQEMSNISMTSQDQAQASSEGVQQEGQTAIITQGGYQAGQDAVLLQGQSAVVGAGQGQIIDPVQREGLLLSLNQGQERIDGAGAQVLGQGAVVAQGQVQATPTTFQAQGQFAGGAQFAAQAGAGGAQLQEQSLTVVAGQGQVAN